MNISIENNCVHNNLNSSLLDVTMHEESDLLNKLNKQKKIEQASHNLFMLSFKQIERSEKIKQEYNNILTQRQKEICSFKPLLIKPKKEIDSDILKLGFVERRDQIKQKFSEK